ncbi:MAG: TCR/Tet family MFS transporter [Rubrivivax sp.]|jgi:DHA1 family tetracycline resistance protein-like MFS transporter|nr:TCR/Tet family MFS transporter [Rubrivivax sp.]
MNLPSPGAAVPRQAAMPFILITVLIDMLSVGLIVPVLPALVGKFSVDSSDQAHWVGVIFVTFSLASFVCAPILSALSDRYGRRPLLLIGFCGLALNFFATALATSIWMLIASRIIGGATQANAAVAQAYVADITPPEERTKRFGLLGAMFGIGFILGPAMGGLLGAIDLHLPFYAAGTLALLNLVYGYFVLPESLPPEKRRAVAWRQANPIASLKQLAKLKGVGMLVGVLACAGLAQYTLYTIWVLYNTYRFGWGPAENGASLFAVGIVSALVQGVLLGRLLQRFTRERLVLWGLVSSGTAYLLWGLATAGWMMYAVIFANILGGVVAASLQGIVSSAADARTQGQTMGAVSGLNSLTAVVGPMLAAPLMGMVSHLPRDDWRVGTPYFFGATLLALAWLMAWLHFRRAAPTGGTASAPSV